MCVLALNVKFVAKSLESKSRLLDLLKRDQAGTYLERGALQFTIGEDAANPLVIHLHEQYLSPEALDVHNQQPYVQAVLDFISQPEPDSPLAEPAILQKYHLWQYDPPFLRREPIQSETAYCLNVESRLRPEARDEFVQLMKSHHRSSQAEPACMQFDWGQSVDSPNHFYIHEQYKDEQGFQAHQASQHFEKFKKFNDSVQPYEKPQQVVFFHTI